MPLPPALGRSERTERTARPDRGVALTSRGCGSARWRCGAAGRAGAPGWRTPWPRGPDGPASSADQLVDRGTTARTPASSATTSAERRDCSTSPKSPTAMPTPNPATRTLRPSGSASRTLTDPSTTKHTVSAGSPSWNTSSPPTTSRSSTRATTASSSSSVRPCSSCWSRRSGPRPVRARHRRQRALLAPLERGVGVVERQHRRGDRTSVTSASKPANSTVSPLLEERLAERREQLARRDRRPARRVGRR